MSERVSFIPLSPQNFDYKDGRLKEILLYKQYSDTFFEPDQFKFTIRQFDRTPQEQEALEQLFRQDLQRADELLSIENAFLRQRYAQELAEQEAQLSDGEPTKIEKPLQALQTKALAFDLNHELEAIEKYRELNQKPQDYWNFFEEQVGFYAKETFGKVERICYTTDIIRGPQGEKRLYIEPMGKTARDSYLQPVARGIGMDWEQKRAACEYRGNIQLEYLMNTHPPGTIFFDVSPAPFDISADQKEGTAYGEHSFGRFYQLGIVKQEDGTMKEVLHCRAIRHYLNLDQQKKLFEVLSKETINRQDLLGKFAVLSPEYDINDVTDDKNIISINKLIKNLVDETPEDQQIKPKEDSFYASTEQMNEYLTDQRWWLKTIFNDLVAGPQRGETENEWKKRIENSFHGYEMALNARIKGEWTAEEVTLFKSTDNNKNFQMEQKVQHALMQRVSDYSQREYKSFSNSCGTGSAFGGESASATRGLFKSTTPIYDGLMNYKSLTQGTNLLGNSDDNEDKSKWEWKKDYCRRRECKNNKDTNPDAKKVMVGPCKVCNECQKDFDSGKLK